MPLASKNIVILGGGYCGVRVAQKLARKLKSLQGFQIIVVDKHPLHLYAADLYEIATAYYPQVTHACLRELKDSISLPFPGLFKGLPIQFLQDEVQSIAPDGHSLKLKKSGALNYEYLVVTLGCVTSFYNIPGVEEKAFPLKTLNDGLALDCHFEELFQERKKAGDHSKLNVVIGGGGFTGVEYACELPGFIEKLAHKYGFEPKEVLITVVQGGPELVGLGSRVSQIALERFKKLGITALCNAKIMGYHDKKLEVQVQGETEARTISADVLVWTAGIKPNPLLKSFPKVDKNGYLEVGPTLEALHYPKVYAGGDNAAIFDAQHNANLPKLGALAVQQAPVIAHNIVAAIEDKAPTIYRPKFLGFIVSLGGKYFVYHREGFTLRGLIPWLMRRTFDLWYFASLLPFKRALKKWWKTEQIFMQND